VLAELWTAAGKAVRREVGNPWDIMLAMEDWAENVGEGEEKGMRGCGDANGLR